MPRAFEKAEHLVKIKPQDSKVRGNSIAEMWRVCNLRE